MLEDVEGLDLDADGKYQSLYDQALTKEYPYVQKIRKTCYRSFKELIEMFPDPAPSEPAIVNPSNDQVDKEGPSTENPGVQDPSAQV